MDEGAGADESDLRDSDGLAKDGEGHDTMTGGSGNRTIYGGRGLDRAFGGSDRLAEGGGAQQIWAGQGACAFVDPLVDGNGHDTFIGAGKDPFEMADCNVGGVYGVGPAGTVFWGSVTHDRFNVETVTPCDGKDRIIGPSDANRIYAGGGTDRVDLSKASGARSLDLVTGLLSEMAGQPAFKMSSVVISMRRFREPMATT